VLAHDRSSCLGEHIGYRFTIGDYDSKYDNPSNEAYIRMQNLFLQSIRFCQHEFTCDVKLIKYSGKLAVHLTISGKHQFTAIFKNFIRNELIVDLNSMSAVPNDASTHALVIKIDNDLHELDSVNAPVDRTSPCADYTERALCQGGADCVVEDGMPKCNCQSERYGEFCENVLSANVSDSVLSANLSDRLILSSGVKALKGDDSNNFISIQQFLTYTIPSYVIGACGLIGVVVLSIIMCYKSKRTNKTAPKPGYLEDSQFNHPSIPIQSTGNSYSRHYQI
jgi:hypothetical protein